MGSFDAVSKGKNLILFDGVCNLCNGAVQFIIKRDPSKRFEFASLQSNIAKERLESKGTFETLETIVLIQKDRILFRSDAALEIARNLSGLWPVFYIFKVVPRFIRDGVYNWIARNRYRFFGKRDTCMIPTPELKSRFID